MEEWNRCTGDTRKKKSEKKLLLLNTNATSNTEMKGEYDCNTLHPPQVIGELRAVSLMLWRWLPWILMQILPRTLSKRVECIFQQKTLPSPSEKKHTHTYTHTYKTTKSNTKHLNSLAYTSINQGTDDKLTNIYFIELKMNFCQKLLKKQKQKQCAFAWNVPPLIECFLYQNSI